MSFAARDLRRGMDVFDADGTYLGSVVWLITRQSGRSAVQPPRDSAARSTFSGEAIGPMPTEALGNSGPRSQASSTAYATTPHPERRGVEDARRPTTLIVLRMLTSLNWSTLRPQLRRISISQVQTVSYERIVLAVPESALT